MRLLFLSIAFPFPATNGLTMRTLSLLESLAALGHEIHLLSFGAPKEASRTEVRQICNTVQVVEHSVNSFSRTRDYFRRLRLLPSPLPYGSLRYRSASFAQKLKDILREKQIDAIVCDTLDSTMNLPEHLPVAVVVDNHNVEHLIMQRYLGVERSFVRRSYVWIEYKKLRAWEKAVCSRADLVLACSEHDQSVIEEMCPGSTVCVVQNAIDTAAYFPVPSKDDCTIVYTGGMDWYPNRDAVEFFASKIFPKIRHIVPNARFVVAGRSASDEFRTRIVAIPGVSFTGTLPDIRPAIAEAAVCIVPLRIGSGTRLKILEAAAMAKAIVSTRLGAEGLAFIDQEEICLADEPVEFAGCVAELLRNRYSRTSLGQAARYRVEAQYSYPALQASVREAFNTLTNSRARMQPESCVCQ